MKYYLKLHKSKCTDNISFVSAHVLLYLWDLHFDFITFENNDSSMFLLISEAFRLMAEQYIWIIKTVIYCHRAWMCAWSMFFLITTLSCSCLFQTTADEKMTNIQADPFGAAWLLSHVKWSCWNKLKVKLGAVLIAIHKKIRKKSC